MNRKFHAFFLSLIYSLKKDQDCVLSSELLFFIQPSLHLRWCPYTDGGDKRITDRDSGHWNMYKWREQVCSIHCFTLLMKRHLKTERKSGFRGKRSQNNLKKSGFFLS